MKVGERAHSEITRILAKEDSWAERLSELAPVIFDDLRRLARYYFSRESSDYHTLQPTALVSEVYLRLNNSRSPKPRNREEFFIYASRLIREILLDHARARQTGKRGGSASRVGFEEALGVPGKSGPSPEVLLTIDKALDYLEQIDPRQTQLVELRYFGGLTLREAAEVLGISRATAERDWSAARRWLARELS